MVVRFQVFLGFTFFAPLILQIDWQNIQAKGFFVCLELYTVSLFYTCSYFILDLYSYLDLLVRYYSLPLLIILCIFGRISHLMLVLEKTECIELFISNTKNKKYKCKKSGFFFLFLSFLAAKCIMMLFRCCCLVIIEFCFFFFFFFFGFNRWLLEIQLEMFPWNGIKMRSMLDMTLLGRR